MKENLNRTEVRDWYLSQYHLIKAVNALNRDGTEQLSNDPEFSNWFLTMFELFAGSFVEFVFSKTKYQTEKRKLLPKRFYEFIEKKKIDKRKEEEYRESRPDLYD